MAFRLYIADAVYYGLGMPLKKSFRDIMYPVQEVDAEAITEQVVKGTGITLI